MNNNIEKRLIELKISFTKIVDIKNDDLNTFNILELRMSKLKETYAEFIQNNKSNLFVFGLDSFRFQSKLIDIEHDDMNRLFLAISNRVYCEYFKLFKIIIQYIQENITDKKLLELVIVNDVFPIYKDLEPYKKYDFDIIQNIHEVLITLLGSLNGILTNKEHELKIYQSKNNVGFNIDNFVNTINYNNIILREKVILFITYLEFFHKLHHKYFKRFTTKLQLMYSQIIHDIKFEDNEELNKTKNRDMLNELKDDDEIDNKILKDLKSSINNDSGSEVGIIESLTSLSQDSNENDIIKAEEKIENNIELIITIAEEEIVEEEKIETNKEEKIEINKEEKIEINKEEEANKEEIEEDDDVSTVTMESVQNTNTNTIDDNELLSKPDITIKPKRKYKARKVAANK
jgi:hypothetical protein